LKSGTITTSHLKSSVYRRGNGISCFGAGDEKAVLENVRETVKKELRDLYVRRDNMDRVQEMRGLQLRD
jgi:hypothetical protein